MAAFTALATLGAAAVGAVASNSAAKSSAKAIQGSTAATNAAADQQVQLAREAQQITSQELSPYANTGSAANDAISKLLGLPASSTPRPAAQPGGASSAAPGARAGDPDFQAYLDANPDLTAYFQRNGGGKLAPGVTDILDFARQHYEKFGKQEGRQLPVVAASAQQPVEATTQQAPVGAGETALPAYAGVATNTNPLASSYEASPFGTMEHDAQATFEDSPWWSIANDEIDEQIGNLDTKYGASGLLLSGGALRARGEVASRLKGDAFDKHYAARTGGFSDYYNALTDTRDTGFQAASGIGNAGTNFATTAGGAKIGAANASANAAVAAAGARQQGVADAAGFLGQGVGSVVGNLKPKAAVKPTPITPISTVDFSRFG